MSMLRDSSEAAAPDPIRKINTNGDSRYALRWLKEVIYSLATHPGRAKDRLHPATQPALLRLHDRDFPDELVSQWRWIKDRLTRKGALLDSKGNVRIDAVANTLRGMHNSTCAKIARHICELKSNLQMHIQWIEDLDRQEPHSASDRGNRPAN